ncbi:PAS-domain containing protein [Saccharospirillum alexandrii]|uniref:PAS-domain containing protein n=1 Tax=Saccharospirillum alexandrii TaxID=2448477 RepID=UPI000FD9C343|nr:PAS-domain containing protein [Saccharospirillum alexandrii]
MNPLRWTLHAKALAAFVVGLVLLLTLVSFSWRGLSQTRDAVNEFEGLLIPEIRTALSLSDEAAQIVALAPYLASAGRPFQLQAERQRLESRYQRVFALSQRLQNPDVRARIQAILANIKADLDALTERVYDELFIREDVLSAQFQVDQQARDSTEAGHAVTIEPWLPLQLFYRAITDPADYNRQTRERLRPLVLAVAEPEAYLDWLELATAEYQTLQGIQQHKAFLLARLRAHSERLTEQTNNFAADIQQVVVRQQTAVTDRVNASRVLTLGLSLVVMLALLVYYLNNRRLIRDLATVTDDMMQLSRREESPAQIPIHRQDEIGDLVHAYDVFREHALQAERTSAELDTQKTLLETIHNQIQDGLSVFSRDDRLVIWNRRYLDIFGFSDGDLQPGMTLDEVQALMARKAHRNLSVQQEAVDMPTMNVQRHQSQQNFERHYDDGQIIEFRSQPMPNGGFVTLYRDLTERRMAEQQLQQAQKMDVLGHLTGGVAHDFNNLLAALSGNLQLLEQSGSVSDAGTPYLHRALDVSERGAQLVQRLLAFSRKQRLTPEVVEPDRLIDGLTELLEYSVSGPVTLTLDLAAPGRSLYIDPSQLENALLNLVLNSVSAIPGKGAVTVRTRYLEQQDRLELTVTDTGQGIPVALQKRVLEPFFSTKPVGQGSGLGLSTVYGFVQQSGGQFTLQSWPGQGTTVCMSWPVTTQLNTPGASVVEHSLTFDASRTLVLVEDDVAVRLALADVLRQRGYPVMAFEHGEQFIDWAHHSDEPAGLVLSDVNLGGLLNGLDVVTMVRKYWPDVPCLLMSGLPRERLEDDLGFAIEHPLLQKPLSQRHIDALFPPLSATGQRPEPIQSRKD